MTLVGNPQNAIIASSPFTHVTFSKFLLRCGLAASVGLVLNTLLLLVLFFRPQRKRSNAFTASVNEPLPVVVLEDVLSLALEDNRPLLVVASLPLIEAELDAESTVVPSSRLQEHDETIPESGLDCPAIDQRNASPYFQLIVVMVIVGVLVSLIAGCNGGWASMTGAFVLLISNVFVNGGDVSIAFGEAVDLPLLVFFSSLFVIMQAFSSTGVPLAIWQHISPLIHVNSLSGCYFLSAVVILMSQFMSNVPLIILLLPLLDSLPGSVPGGPQWYITAFAATVGTHLCFWSGNNSINC